MSGKTDQWFPLYVGDYLADTRRLTTEQHGAYMLLIMDYWRSGPPPDDDAVLAQITGLTLDRWKEHRPILSRFFQINRGEWRHKRIDAELEKAKEVQSSLSDRGHAGAEARWAKKRREQCLGDATANAQAMLGDAPSPVTSTSTNTLEQPPALPPLQQGQDLLSHPEQPDETSDVPYTPDFEEAWAIYPKRSGDNPKHAAFKAWNARLRQGHTAMAMTAGVNRYALFVRANGNEGTQYVKHASSFFGPNKHFLESWPVGNVIGMPSRTQQLIANNAAAAKEWVSNG